MNNTSVLLVIVLQFFSFMVSLCSMCDQVDCCAGMQPNKFFISSVKTHGAAVYAVAWLCQDLGGRGPLAAVGGFPVGEVNGNAEVRIYRLTRSSGQLNDMTTLTVGFPVNSLSFCYIGCEESFQQEGAYLVVGGSPAVGCPDVVVYHVDVTNLAATRVASFTHGATVRSVAWLDKACADCRQRYLAIGGDIPMGVGDGNEIKVLLFDAAQSSFVQTIGLYHGATIYSVDWCDASPETALLAAGGERSTEALNTPTVHIYRLDCQTGCFQEVTNKYYGVARVDVVKWCCDILDKPYLALGESRPNNNVTSTVAIYSLDVVNTYSWNLISSFIVPGKLSSLAWVPANQCSCLTIGLACTQDDKAPNVLIYAFNVSSIPVLVQRVEGHVSALSWCQFCGCSYLLIGTEPRSTGNSDDFPCAQTRKEVVLCKGVFCKGVPTIQAPSGFCLQKQYRRFPLQTNIVNIISWNSVPAAAYYDLYCDKELKNRIARIKATDPLVYKDYCADKNVQTVYYIVAVNSDGGSSVAAQVTL